MEMALPTFRRRRHQHRRCGANVDVVRGPLVRSRCAKVGLDLPAANKRERENVSREYFISGKARTCALEHSLLSSSV